MDFIKIESKDEISYLTLNRPEKKNAFNIKMIRELTEAIKHLEAAKECRVIIIRGEGDTFSAGADLSWMKEQIHKSFDENLKESNDLFDMFLAIKTSRKPVISYVNKYVMGGAIGIVAASDYCFAAQDTQFCFSETLMGLAPAVIAPFVLDKCHGSLAQKYMMFAEFFDAHEAYQMGLVQKTGSGEDISSAFDSFLEHLMRLDLKAVSQAKLLIANIKNTRFEEHRAQTTQLISRLRIEDSAQQRLKSFLERKHKM